MIELKYGTEQEHRATLSRARKAKVNYIWSGLLRKAYLRENFQFGLDEKIFTAKFVETEQESGWDLTWNEQIQ